MLIPIRIDRTSKPPLGTPLRSDGHWSVQGLVGAWALNEGGGGTAFDAVSGHNIGLVGATFNNGGLLCDADSERAQIPAPATLCGGGDITITIALRPIGEPSTNVNIFGVTHDATDATPYAGYGLSYGVTGYKLNTNSAGVFSDLTSTTLYTSAKEIVISGVFTLARRQLFINGRSVAITTETLGNRQYGSNPQLILGGYAPNTTRNSNAVYDFAFIHFKELSPGEISSISANPWQIYEPETVWIEVGGADVPVNHGAALMMGM